MKTRYSLLAALLMLIGASQAMAQCSGGTSAGTITPLAAYQTATINDNSYFSFAATAGLQYTFSFCNGGGSTPFDSQITILDNTGAYAGGYSDDVCGVASEVVWTAPSTGTFRVLVNSYYCSSGGGNSTLAYRLFVPPPPPPGATCANAHVIPSLPFSANGLTTCGAGNEYTSGSACGSSYLNGEDYVFTYTATGPQTIQIALTGTLGYTGIFVTQGCPSGGTCIATAATSCGSGGGNTSSSGNPTATFALPSAGTYFFTVDTWPSPACTPFNISVTAVGGGGGPGCGSYTESTPAFTPFSFTTGTTLTFPDDQFSSAIPIPFTFCFMGSNYSSMVVSSNAYITFNTTCATLYSGWNTDVIPNPAATNRPEVRNSIMFPWSDINPNSGGTIRYNTYGTAPNRRFVVAYNAVPMFSASCSGSAAYTGQVVLHETTHIIEIFVQNYSSCTAWNSGEGVIGLLDASGTVAVPVAGYNNTVFNLSNFARRFTPNCPTCTVPLPTEFTTITGQRGEGRNHLRWSTDLEVNTESFTLERSGDGQNFETVGTLAAAGSSSEGRTYVMDDLSPKHPVTYYRVMGRDIDGAESHSEVISISSLVGGLGITSLAREEQAIVFTVYNEDAAQSANVEIVDLLGRVAATTRINLQTGSTSSRMETAHLRAGTYMLRINTPGGLREARKFVVE